MPPRTDARLARMKWTATGLLAAAAALYAVARPLSARHPAWGFAAAFAEAAMVGAVADWFAVVALFRRPLGLPIPHTAIIPENKDRIGENLAAFICEHFLSTPQVLDKLRALDVPERLASWLSRPETAQQLAAYAAAALSHSLPSLREGPARHFFLDAVTRRLHRLDAARLAGELLQMLTAHGRHERLLEDGVRQLAVWLDNDTIKEKLADVVATEVKFLRFVGLDAVAGRYATAKLLGGLAKLLGEVGDDPGHPLRSQVSGFMVAFAERLKTDDALREKVGAIQQELLAHPQLSAALNGLWDDMLAWTGGDLARPDSVLRERAVRAVQHLGERLAGDAAMRQWLQDNLLRAAPALIERHREDIRRYIVERVHAWDAAEMTRELERHIGRDLQFIRINGTLVGGLVGLLIHALTALVQRAAAS